jgi:hypothetical protein
VIDPYFLIIFFVASSYFIKLFVININSSSFIFSKVFDNLSNLLLKISKKIFVRLIFENLEVKPLMSQTFMPELPIFE